MTDFNPIFEFSQNELEPASHFCIICNQTINDHNNTFRITCDRLQMTSYCQCNPYMHPNCFSLWYSKSPTCPVCRITITPMDNNSDNIDNSDNSDNITTISTLNESNIFFNFCLFCCIGIIIIYCILAFFYWVRID
mgnify:CR=1 FL=1